MSQHLAIELSQFGIKYSIIEKLEVVSSYSASFSVSEDTKAQCESFLTEEGIFQKSFDEITLSWYNNRATMIPATVFGESNPKDIYQLCFPEIDSDFDIDYNRMPTEGVVNIYSIPSWVKRFFVVKFPRITIQHCTSHIVRAGLSEDAFKPKFVLSIYENTFHISLFRHNDLQFFSFFEAQTIEDIVYYLSYVLEQKELISEKGKIIFAGNQEKRAKQVDEMLQKIDLFKNYSTKIDSNFISKAQLQCV